MWPKAPVAQLDRVLPSEGRGRTFESCQARQILLLQAFQSNHEHMIRAQMVLCQLGAMAIS